MKGKFTINDIVFATILIACLFNMVRLENKMIELKRENFDLLHKAKFQYSYNLANQGFIRELFDKDIEIKNDIYKIHLLINEERNERIRNENAKN